MVRISDEGLVKILLENARKPYVEIARSLKVTEAAVRKRIKKLEERGIIRRYTIDIDPRKLGYEAQVFIGVDAAPEHYVKVMNDMKAMEEVIELYSTSGDHMFIAECWLRSARELADFVERLEKLEGVTRVCPAIVLEKVK